ncbi:MAG: diguanylate cyclase [Alphaproteobacteria bacterium]
MLASPLKNKYEKQQENVNLPMPRALLQVLILLASLLVVLAVGAVFIEFLALVPPPQVMDLRDSFVKDVPLLLDWATWAEHKVNFYKVVVRQVWPFWLLPLFWLLVWALFYGVARRMQLRALAEHAYFLESNLDRTTQQAEDTRQHLRTVHETLFAAYDQAPDALIHISAEGYIEQLNMAAQRLLAAWVGHEEQFLRRKLADILPHYAQLPLAAGLVQVLKNAEAWRGHFTVGNMWLEATSFVGEHGAYVMFRDLTFTRADTATLHNVQALLPQLLQGAAAVAILDADGCYTQTNTAWTTLFGLPDMPLTGQVHAKVLPTFPPEWPAVQAQVVRGQSVMREEAFKLHGVDAFLRWSARPWRDAYGQLGGTIVQVEDVTEHVKLRQRMTQLAEQENMLAYHDMLTGLPNRQLFYDRLNVALANAYRQLTRVGLLFLDLDGFKAVNDNLGHDAGDMLLKAVALRLQECLRETDTVCRLGGDEFTVIVNIRQPQDCELVARKIVDAINQPYTLGTHRDVRVSTSIGIAMYPTHGGNAADLIKKADAAMYVAKHTGKNQYKFYETDMEEKAPVREPKMTAVLRHPLKLRLKSGMTLP